MSEKKIIDNTKQTNTVDSIYRDLSKLGIKSDDTLLVHSSLSSLGWVCAGAQSVIIVLLKSVSNGTLVMPTHSGDWSDPAKWENPPVPKEWLKIIYENMPAYDKDITPTRFMGKIPELFRILPNSIRSNHPQTSFCANGKYAKKITEDHPLTQQMGMESPLGALYRLGAKVLLLGVEYDSCTSFHLAETLNKNMPKEKTGTSIIEDGKRIWKWFSDYTYDSEDFEKLGRDFEKNSLVTKGKVGNAQCILFDMKTGVNFAAKWLSNNREYK